MQTTSYHPTDEVQQHARIADFMTVHNIDSLQTLRERSVTDPAWFWNAVVEYLGLPFSHPYDNVFDISAPMPWTTWFNGGQCNVYDACVTRWLTDRGGDRAIVAETDDGQLREWSFAELDAQANAIATTLVSSGISKGDVVGIYMPMTCEIVAAVLGVVKLGAVFLPLFSGYGADAIATRLQDAEAKALLTVDGFLRRGKRIDALAIAQEAASHASVTTIVAAKRLGDVALPDAVTPWPNPSPLPNSSPLPNPSPLRRQGSISDPHQGETYKWIPDQVRDDESKNTIPTVQVESEHPLFISYTSGTTGKPKGVVHVHGGFLVKITEEVAFQTDVGQTDTLFWFTDMGWIMGQWEVIGGLANGATIALFEGVPDYPDVDRLWAFCEGAGVTVFGAAPTLIRSLMAHGEAPVRKHDLSAIRILGSTGEPWNKDPWLWYFTVVGGGRCPVINISGGTEIGACLLSPHPIEDIAPMSLGGPALGMAVDVFDDAGNAVRNAVGELVCKAPWPSMTRGLWRDPDRFMETYFSRWPNVWYHGDWASVDDGQWYLHGRSDDTIKVAGKRLGPAEVESACVSHPAVHEAVAIGYPSETKGEVLWVLVVASEETEQVRDEIRDTVARSVGTAFRPDVVKFVSALPKTRNGKVLRRVVRAVCVGEDLADLSSLEDPATLNAIREAR